MSEESARTFLGFRVEKPFPHAEAAELRTEKLWVCRSCGRAWAAEEWGERAARTCCTYQKPCGHEGCVSLSGRHDSFCPPHQAMREAEAWAKRERGHLNGHMIFSDRLDKYFAGEGEVWDYAEELAGEALEDDTLRDPTADEIRAEIEKMRLLLCEPEKPPVFEAARHLEDWLPEGDHDSWLDNEDLREAEKAVNSALEGLPPVFMPTSKALDLACFEGPNGPYKARDAKA